MCRPTGLRSLRPQPRHSRVDGPVAAAVAGLARSPRHTNHLNSPGPTTSRSKHPRTTVMKSLSLHRLLGLLWPWSAAWRPQLRSAHSRPHPPAPPHTSTHHHHMLLSILRVVSWQGSLAYQTLDLLAVPGRARPTVTGGEAEEPTAMPRSGLILRFAGWTLFTTGLLARGPPKAAAIGSKPFQTFSA